MPNLVPIYDMQHYIKFPGTNEDYIRITEDNSLDPDRENEEYETQYLDRKRQATYVLSSKDTIDFEVDLLTPSPMQAKLAQYEDVPNVEVEYVRTLAYDVATGTAAPATARVAKKAAAILNVKPFKGAAGEPIKISANLSIYDEYTYGTFNESTGEFTAASSSQSG